MIADHTDALEHFEERAAIIEHEAWKSRAVAESMALREVSERYGKDAARFVNERRKE